MLIKTRVLLLLIFIHALGHEALAFTQNKKSLLRSHDVDQDYFEAYAAANGYVPFSKRLLEELPSEKLNQVLSAHLEKAQAAWLEGSIANARTHFKRIAELKHDADWNKAQREAIHYSLTRLGQISESARDRDAYFEEASLLDLSLKSDPNLFPPPVREEFQAMQKRLHSQARYFEPEKVFRGYQIFILNGRRFEIQPGLRVLIPPGRHRVTALSDSLEPFTDVLSLSQLETLSAPVKPLVNGKCQSATLQVALPADLKEVDVLFADDCIQTIQTTNDLKNLVPDFDKKGLLDSARLLSLSQATHQLPNPTEAKYDVASIRKRWLLVGVSALVAGAAYTIIKETNKEPEKKKEISVVPVYRKGF